MIDDENVRKHSLSPPGYGGDARTAAVIFKLAGQLQPEVSCFLLFSGAKADDPQVQTLSLANNNLKGVHLLYLDRYLPKLRNLSLQGNALKTWNDLDNVGARRDKMKCLRELVLIGTPLRDMEYKNGRGDRYRRYETLLSIYSYHVLTSYQRTGSTLPCARSLGLGGHHADRLYDRDGTWPTTASCTKAQRDKLSL